VPAQVCISLDNTTLTVDGFLYLQITDAVKAAYGSSNPMNAAMQLAQTNMRSEIGKLHLDQALSSRQMLNAAVAAAVEEAAVNWGIKVLRYEIKDITPPQAILHAMELQITAEREKRAMIFKSEGERQQQINTSEGQRQREINLADGRRQAEILRAEGEAKAIALASCLGHRRCHPGHRYSGGRRRRHRSATNATCQGLHRQMGQPRQAGHDHDHPGRPRQYRRGSGNCSANREGKLGYVAHGAAPVWRVGASGRVTALRSEQPTFNQ
jgi:hypothetical protein